MMTNMRGVRAEKLVNQRRQAYSTQQSSGNFIFIIALILALGVHIALFFIVPEFDIAKLDPVQQREEVYRVDTMVTESKDELDIPLPEISPEPEVLAEEEVEIDILDAEYEELVMAPGETRLALPEISEPVPVDALELGMEESSHQKMFDALKTIASEPINLPEPTPLNENPTVVKAQASMNALDTSDLLDGELLAQVEHHASLPSDTRSLSDLLKVKDLGANSGVARLGADVLFAFGENTLRNSARVPLIQFAALIRKNPATRFIIEGHTDSFGSKEYNYELSLRRAAAVRDWLKGNNLPLVRIYIRGCGNTNPLAERDGSREQQALNRRVEIHMRRASEPLPSGALDAGVAIDMGDDD